MKETLDLASVLWLVPLLPAAGALLNGLRAVARPFDTKNKILTDIIALGSTLASALVATFLVVIPYVRHGIHHPHEVVYYSWIPSGLGQVAGNFLSSFDVELGFQIDTLSCTMLMVVAWVGFLIHLYATGYMAHEKGYTRFFSYLNLFMFMMLLLVLGNNYAVMFVGWEGVGLCSYLLIGFYYDKNFAADAGKKAFITNRIGDWGFILGIFLIFNYFGTSDYTRVFAMASADPERYGTAITTICLLLFLGACGKSAQVPLHVWLPDAMAGPTPVSALIHAATMVTAGVYMVVRSNVLYRLSPEAMVVVALVGAFTAIFAATIGVAQNDIKRVLAYSTVSQLGFMFLAAGVGAYSAAIFHLMTHAFFKACLFLGSGSAIHGSNGEQDMRKMGGLRKYMPITHWTFLVATIAIAGIPPLAGFFSKDEILAGAFLRRFDELASPWKYVPLVCWVLGIIAATFTAFYMFRLYFMTFWGEYRGTRGEVTEHADAHAAHPHESGWRMTWVLVVLAIFSVVGGLVGPPLGAFGIHAENPFQRWLHPIVPAIGEHEHAAHPSIAIEWFLILISVAVAGFGIWLARRFYGVDPSWSRPRAIAERFPWLYRLVANKYYVDELYYFTVVSGTILLSDIMTWIDIHIVDGLVNLTRHLTVIFFGHGSDLVDRYLVDGVFNGMAGTARRSSTVLRKVQTGFVQNYALIMGGGLILLAAVYLITKP